MRIDQILVGTSAGDAITEAARSLQDALRRIGPSDMYAAHPNELLGLVRPLSELPPGADDDVTIFHVSMGQPEVHHMVTQRPGRLVLSYHNITPARFYDPVDAYFALMLRRGRQELRQVAGHAHGAVADSMFNAAELAELGLANVEVAPPPLNIGRLRDVDPDLATMRELADLEGPLVLVVGQILPHKRPDLAVDVHHFVLTNHVPNAHLALVGTHRLELYSSAIVRHVEALNLPSVRMTGAVSDAVLAAYFRSATVLLVPSEHEGFCVPLVEAMALGVPVVARDFGAISETAGDAALVLPSTAGSAVMAEAVGRVLTDAAVRAELVRRGSTRAELLSPERTLEANLGALARVLGKTGRELDQS